MREPQRSGRRLAIAASIYKSAGYNKAAAGMNVPETVCVSPFNTGINQMILEQALAHTESCRSH